MILCEMLVIDDGSVDCDVEGDLFLVTAFEVFLTGLRCFQRCLIVGLLFLDEGYQFQCFLDKCCLFYALVIPHETAAY